jgi:hypothetical protein
MAMDAERLKQILDLHKKWLADEEGGKCADLSGADLRRAVLRHAVLSDADLSDAVLSDAVLRAAVLSDAVLSDADLSGAVLSGADLSGAVLRHADLSGADLSGAVLSGADLSGADLSGAVLSGAVWGGQVPEVPGICRAILQAIEAEPESLDMDSWHKETACGTTHCMAGWAIHLAGKEGYELEAKVGPAAAGSAIFAKSCGKVPNFYSSNDVVLAWLRDNAEPATV